MTTFPSAPDFKPQSEPWRREVEARIKAAEERNERLSKELRAYRKGTGASIRALTAGQVVTLDRVDTITAPPPAPTTLTAVPFAYYDASGQVFGGVDLAWSMDLEDEVAASGSAAQFEVWLRETRASAAYPTAEGDPIPPAPEDDSGRVTATPHSYQRVLGLKILTEYAVKIRPISPVGAPGDFSAETVFTTPTLIAPLTPPEPIVSSERKVVVVRVDEWDSIPSDRHILAEASLDEGGPYQRVGAPFGVSSIAFPAADVGADLGDEVWVRLIAVNSAGGESAPSTPVMVIVVGIEGPDIEADSIDANHISAGSIDGMVITGATMRTAEDGQRVQLDEFGIRSFNSSEDETARLSASTGGLEITGRFITANAGAAVTLFNGAIELQDDYSTSPAKVSATSSYIPMSSGLIVHGGGIHVPTKFARIEKNINSQPIDTIAMETGVVWAGTVFQNGRPSGSTKMAATNLAPASMEKMNYSFSAASDVILNGIFSDLYRRYRIYLTVTSMSAAGSLFLRLTTGGTPDTTSNYWYTRNYNNPGSPTSVQSSSEAQFEIVGGTAIRHEVELTIANPATALVTSIKGLTESNNGTSVEEIVSILGGRFQGTTIFDGISIIPTSGNITGTIDVEGIV